MLAAWSVTRVEPVRPCLDKGNEPQSRGKESCGRRRGHQRDAWAAPPLLPHGKEWAGCRGTQSRRVIVGRPSLDPSRFYTRERLGGRGMSELSCPRRFLSMTIYLMVQTGTLGECKVVVLLTVGINWDILLLWAYDGMCYVVPLSHYLFIRGAPTRK